MSPWRIGVDSGGTFTDVCLFDEQDGRVEVWKVPSTPDDPSRGIAGGVEEGLSRRDLVAQGFNEAVVNDVVRKVDLNEYKRKQAAPGLKITPLAFGVGRRIPIVQKYVS